MNSKVEQIRIKYYIIRYSIYVHACIKIPIFI